jgi:hypothetical protein
MKAIALLLAGASALGCGSEPVMPALPASSVEETHAVSEVAPVVTSAPTSRPAPTLAAPEATVDQTSGAPEPPSALQAVSTSSPRAPVAERLRKAEASARVTEMCGPPRGRTCYCKPGDILCAIACTEWDTPAPAGMLGNCLAQCRAGKSGACLRAALSFDGGVGTASDPDAGLALLTRACTLGSGKACRLAAKKK